jgi:hypothetical protein
VFKPDPGVGKYLLQWATFTSNRIARLPGNVQLPPVRTRGQGLRPVAYRNPVLTAAWLPRLKTVGGNGASNRWASNKRLSKTA